MAALSSHLVGQRSFYPLFPAPLGAGLDTANYSSVELHTTPQVQPGVLCELVAVEHRVLSARTDT